jgi:Phosphate-selective porin O and P
MKNAFWLYGGVAVTLGLAMAAQAAEPTQEDLQKEIEALKAKVDELEKTQQQQAATTKADVDATVQAVLRDADLHSQMFQGTGITANWSDGKFVVQSRDGNFLIHPYLQFQLRNTTTWREDGKQPNDTDDVQNGFEVRRAKVGVEGNVFSPNLTYQFQMQFDRKSGTPGLEDAWMRYKFAEQFSLRAGQFKDPFAHESIVSSKRLLAAERDYTNDYFSNADDYVQGVSLIYDAKGPLHAELAFTDGSDFVTAAGTRNDFNQNFQDFGTNNADYGGAARVEYLAFGDWKDYDSFSAYGAKSDLLVFGGGLDYTEAGNTGFFSQTVDVQYKMTGGLALYAAYYGRYTKDSPAAIDAPGAAPAALHNLYDWGVVAQASYMINPKLEIFGRYGYLDLDSDGLASGTENHVHEITAGGNYYFEGHNAKLTLDGGYLPNGAPIADDGAGILASKNDEFYLRCQFQLLL